MIYPPFSAEQAASRRCKGASGIVSFSFQVLGSSSDGNATLLHFRTPAGERRLLLDAGLGPRTVAKRLADARQPIEPIHAIVLTHADTDHMRPSWRRTLEREAIPVYVPASHHQTVVEQAVPSSLARPYTGAFEPFPGLAIHPLLAPHDEKGSCALRITSDGGALGWATDLGCVDDALIDHFGHVDALGIESNYDLQMQLASGRPPFLIRRIIAEYGHLSNEDCLMAVRAIASAQARIQPLDRIVLLHLSQTCNSRDRVWDLWTRRAADLLDRIEIARPDRASARVLLGSETSAASTPAG